ncbi:bifunctional diaminohydroxyphosphoribosylaminopyrimidine deaminase/5-amino-6-(5-phosphoribosylamino)uracil reductase RibD [Acidovorax sp. sic0104]|uniref:bifunctional diaminohydroxyphosphoribosylaminopyrimidine deaminase/5-amino-6-(5-phosphoribosylamino)uracil reductase RibD n=2 Tax=Acidovorax sp. sic0104 TaxID=2854784 RepID=UPI001C48A625|nr:bifunctional diaminohydroxyphosphoribosylaminopyrimidine deaminase/5-amino-6-(5-phosphoribosylamino)uracil reductase RibD [Acidovorax sp. sic0104]MBV7539560.1 bifunctional diaminohydroxyphosphoribosylaminopyrimidine deaminase/5-amino-6-(5-phosphoribosylamino)uracil reductase RibD [Acidovorax sp. sic0104]
MSSTAPAPMNQALELAAQALFLSNPNPRVGCVIVAPDGQIIGQGFTQQAGGPHAEVMALRDAASAHRDTRGATAYVTLEPCSHQGRTGPCCDALIQAGITKVVASLQDPNPLVGGRGFDRLRAAGIDVVVGPGEQASRELNIGFFSRMVRGTPWVRLKTAASLDGTTALENGASQWITSAQARADGHAWRARACAVLTGIGTVLDDNPRLDVRDVASPRQPHVVVVDSRLQTPPDASVLTTTGRTCYIYAAVQDKPRQAALESRGAQVIHLPNAQGKVDLAAMLKDLGHKGINELHVEAGHKLNGSLVREGLVDELLVYLAPRWLGEGARMADFGPLEALAEGIALQFTSVDRFGPDLRIVARFEGRDRF